MALARDRHRDGGRTRLARWVTRGLQTLGGTGIIVLASAGLAASASADDGESLVGEVVAGITGTVGTAPVTPAPAPVPAAVAEAQELPVLDVSAAVVEPAPRDVVAPAVEAVAPVVERVAAPTAEHVTQPVVAELTPVTSAVTDVLSPVVDGVVRPVTDELEPVLSVVRPVTDELEPVTGLVTEVVSPVLSPVAGTPLPCLGPEVDVVPAAGGPSVWPSTGSAVLATATDPVTSRSSDGAAATLHLAASAAGRSITVAMPSLISEGSQSASDPGAAAGGRSTTSSGLPVSAPPASGSVGPSHGAGSADADLARSLAQPVNDLSLTPAAAPPSAFLEVLLEISVAPD